VIDEHGVIRWRYVAGVDAIPQSPVATAPDGADVEHARASRSRGATSSRPRSPPPREGVRE